MVVHKNCPFDPRHNRCCGTVGFYSLGLIVDNLAKNTWEVSLNFLFVIKRPLGFYPGLETVETIQHGTQFLCTIPIHTVCITMWIWIKPLKTCYFLSECWVFPLLFDHGSESSAYSMKFCGFCKSGSTTLTNTFIWLYTKQNYINVITSHLECTVLYEYCAYTYCMYSIL